ncbi:uncharacterized protein [Penaeus vannamei]|uniref:uncharacterized protein n=1 Tax=Penaeus vannamei TaxID=6689 RepID=UPI00387F6AD3
MFTVIKTLCVVAFLALLSGPGAAVLNDRPRMRCDEGHLYLEGGQGKNISLVTKGRGAVVINGLDIAGSISLVSPECKPSCVRKSPVRSVRSRKEKRRKRIIKF